MRSTVSTESLRTPERYRSRPTKDALLYALGTVCTESRAGQVKGDRARLTSEAADVVFHLLVMLASRDVTLADVQAELERREGTSGLSEKAARGPATPG